MAYETKITVRSYECDSYSHVNNAVYLNYLEAARMDYLHQIGFRYKDAVAQGIFLYVTHIDIFYKTSAVLDDELTVETEPVKFGAVSGTFHQKVTKDGGKTVCAEADVTWCSVDSNTGRPCRIPDEYVVDGLKPSKK